MDSYDRQRLQGHARRIEELHLWGNSREQRIECWWFSVSGGAAEKIRLGDYWPKTAVPAYLWTETEIPESWTGEPIELELWLGGEGFVRLSNGVAGGLDPFHRSFPVMEKARGGERLQIEAEVVPRNMFGSNVSEPRLVRARLVVPEVEVRGLARDLATIHEACTALDDHEIVPHLLDAFEATTAVFSKIWPTATGTAVARYLERYNDHIGDSIHDLPRHYAEKVLDVSREGGEPWSLPPAPTPLEPLSGEAREMVREARHVLKEKLGHAKQRYPQIGSLALTGHAHLDLAWLWPIEESRRKARRTFSSVLGLMERYEDFAFNQSSAQLYAWIEEDDPGMFRRMIDRVAEGRWEPVGGMWVEPDCQIIGGESLVRQLLYGQRYFESRFGHRPAVVWLPDTFGFSPTMPQLLKDAGLTGFFTYKLNWSETNEFPYDLFEWEGLDGSRVLVHTFKNPGTDYNGDICPDDLLGTWKSFRGKRRHTESLFSFGWGDGGGGPTEKMLESYARLKDFPALPRLRMARVEEFFASLPKENLPRWVGELYLELHRGTLTTQGETKKLNREAEHRLLEAEAFAATASLRGVSYPAEKLEGTWKDLLLNQFHDILPGTSIREVYEDSLPQLRSVVEAAVDVRNSALRCLAAAGGGGKEAALVANASLHPRQLSIILTGYEASGAADAKGNVLPSQQIAEGLLVHHPDSVVPALGWTILYPTTGGARGGASGGVRAVEDRNKAVTENESLRVTVGPDGTLHSVYDKEADREVLDGRGNRILAYTDKPRKWDAWDVEANYESEGEELSGPARITVTEKGPLRGAIRVEWDWRDSRIIQTYKLLSASRRLDVETEIHWHERQVLLRALFPVRIRSHEATYETMFGAVRRPTHHNTTWDAARFEVAAHRFCDLSEPGYGVALLNNGKYGHSAHDNVLGISLLRSPLYPDPYADEGRHHFTYSLFPHADGWGEAGVTREAFALNSPLCAVPLSSNEIELSQEAGFLSAGGVELALGSLKRTEDGRALILRLYEPHGARGAAALRFDQRIVKVERTGLLEDSPKETLPIEDRVVRFEARPFEVITLRLETENSIR